MINFRSKITKIILGYLLLNPEREMYINEMVQKFKVDRRNLVKKLHEWELKSIVIKNQRGNLSLYKINKKYPLFFELNRIAQKSFGLEKELFKALKKVGGVKSAIVFGSYAKNEMEIASDIDMLLVGSHSSLAAQKLIIELQKKYDREINVIDLTEKEFNKKKDSELIKEIFKNKHIKII